MTYAKELRIAFEADNDQHALEILGAFEAAFLGAMMARGQSSPEVEDYDGCELYPQDGGGPVFFERDFAGLPVPHSAERLATADTRSIKDVIDQIIPSPHGNADHS